MALVSTVLAGALACSGSRTPTQPTEPPVTGPPSEPPPPSPPPPNTPPKLDQVRTHTDRIEIEGEVEVTADVSDEETHVDQLTYEWSAAAGSFSGSGRVVRWRAPKDDRTPTRYTIKVTVVEKYQEGTEAKEHRVSGESRAVNVNNSPKELRDLAGGFLNDFSNSSVAPETCVREFSDKCPGKKDELADIRENRAKYVITSSRWSIDSVRISDARDSAEILASCSFTSTEKATGKVGTTSGTCRLTAVYEPYRWWLCESHFSGRSTFTWFPF